jgi:hypothetical protein
MLIRTQSYVFPRSYPPQDAPYNQSLNSRYCSDRQQFFLHPKQSQDHGIVIIGRNNLEKLHPSVPQRHMYVIDIITWDHRFQIY